MTDESGVASISGVAVAADSSLFSDDVNFSITESMVSFLRMEANHADERAKRLRKQAAKIAVQFGITDESQKSYDLDPTDLPPLDEKGLPKYKGKKRGRKPKEKKRKMNPNRPKRRHTGYTLFMQDMYPVAKSECPDLPSKALISMVAKRWQDLNEKRKNVWKERAQQSSDEGGEQRSKNIGDDGIDSEVARTNNSFRDNQVARTGAESS